MMNFNILYVLFLKVLNMSITASVVILFVLVARFFLRKLPKIFSYLLWSVVVFRLICPFSFTVPFSLLDFTSPKSVENGMVVYISADTVNMGEPGAAGVLENGGDTDHVQSLSESGRQGRTPAETAVLVMAYVWLLGILGIAGYSMISFAGLKRKLVGAVKCDGNVWVSDHVSASFVMGIFHPEIYLWSGLSKDEREFVIVHEKKHIRRGDHLAKLLFYLVLTVHWFNPLVWLSYFLCMKDMEMSCDESVMKGMGRDVRADYSESLLSLATGRKRFAGTPLFFAEGDTKARIKNILSCKKPTVWAVTAGIIVVAVLCIGFMGNPSESAPSEPENYLSPDEEYGGVENSQSQTEKKADGYTISGEHTHSTCGVDGCTISGEHTHSTCGVDGCTISGEHTHSSCGVDGCTISGEHTHSTCGVDGCTISGEHTHEPSTGHHSSGHEEGHH